MRRQRSLPVSPADRVEVGAGNQTSVAVESVIAAFDEIERRKLEGMTAEHLIRSARQLRKSVADRPQAIRRLEVALTRDITDSRRAEVMTMLGVWQRELKTPQALAASARAFQAVVDRHGLVSEYGQDAAYQLIWTFSEQKDPQRGLELARTAIQVVGAPHEFLMKARYAEAVMIEGLGNKVQARAAYTRLLSDLGVGDARLEWLRVDLQERLTRK